MREINRDPGAGIMGCDHSCLSHGVSLMSWPASALHCWLLLSRLQTSEQWRRDALRSQNIVEQLFTAATRLMWSGPLWIIDSEILLLWAVNAKLCRTTNEVVRIVNCQNMIWARERRHEQPVTRITRRGKLRSENKEFLQRSSPLTSIRMGEWNLEEQCKLDVDLTLEAQ